MIYLTFLSVAFFCAYYVLFYFFPLFFEKRIPKLIFRTLIFALLLSLLNIVLSITKYWFPSDFWGDRYLHFGGGFLAALLCYLAVKGSQTRLTPFQFFWSAIMIAALLGIWNELLEFLLQTGYGNFFVFSKDALDTWYDLLANQLGSLTSALIFLFFL